jgi:threonine/homoserine/homoserine lactone efflux protein
MESIINGVISGIVLALMIGPVFFSLIQTSIERGFRSGFFVAIGVSLSDAFYISLAYLGIYQIFDRGNFREYLAYCGGGVLLAFGCYYLFVKSRKLSPDVQSESVPVKSPFKLIAKGFIINGLTPMVLIFWIGTVSIATTKFGYDTPGKALPYFVAIVATVFTTDIIKAKLADKLRLVLTSNVIRTLNVILGIAMIVFGARMILIADHFTGF